MKAVRLRTDYLDVLLLHRPDSLMEPEEVAAAFDELEKSIVASLAKDVLVGVKGDRIDITMVYGLNS